jgi:uncharacterized membrane protein
MRDHKIPIRPIYRRTSQKRRIYRWAPGLTLVLLLLLLIMGELLKEIGRENIYNALFVLIAVLFFTSTVVWYRTR